MRCLQAAQPGLLPVRPSCGCTAAPALLRLRSRRRPVCSATLEQVAELGAGGGLNTQDAIVGGLVLGLIAASVAFGLRGEPQVCDICQGTGGARCFACEGSGSQAVDASLLAKRPRRDAVGRKPADPSQCRVCGGTGLVLCRQCSGSGYRRRV